MDVPVYLNEELKIDVGELAWAVATDQDRINLEALRTIRLAFDDDLSKPVLEIRGRHRHTYHAPGRLNVWLELGNGSKAVEAVLTAQGHLLFSPSFLDAIDRYSGSEEEGSGRLTKYRIKIQTGQARQAQFFAARRALDPLGLDGGRTSHRDSPLSKFLMEKISGVSAPTAHM